jgi:hypothetical protein
MENARLINEARERSIELANERDVAERARSDIQALLDNMADGMGIAERDGRIAIVNRALFDING